MRAHCTIGVRADTYDMMPIMEIHLFIVIAIMAYLGAATVQCLELGGKIAQPKPWIVLLGVVAVCLHGMLLHRWIDIQAQQNLNFFNLLSLSAWLVSILLLAVMLLKPVNLLTAVVFPLTVLTILLVLFFPRELLVKTELHPVTLFHIILSILSFCVLSLAGLFAVLLATQERLLRYKKAMRLIERLPPLCAMETLLFQVVSVGFVLLTIVMITSAYFYADIVFTQTVLLQKSALVMVAWVVFALLLLGRYRWGWRGRRAIYFTLMGVALLFVAYYGSKLVLEVMQ